LAGIRDRKGRKIKTVGESKITIAKREVVAEVTNLMENINPSLS
jgi:hypothetical protein